MEVYECDCLVISQIRGIPFQLQVVCGPFLILITDSLDTVQMLFPVVKI